MAIAVSVTADPRELVLLERIAKALEALALTLGGSDPAMIALTEDIQRRTAELQGAIDAIPAAGNAATT